MCDTPQQFRAVEVDVDGVPVVVHVPADATVVRAVVLVATERMGDTGHVRAGSWWSASAMDGDHLEGMLVRAQRAVAKTLDGETV